MIVKVFSEDLKFIAGSNKDVFTIKVSNDTQTINYFLNDDEVKVLQTLCEYHLRGKANNND